MVCLYTNLQPRMENNFFFKSRMDYEKSTLIHYI